MAFTVFTAAVVVHLPGGVDLLLRNRIEMCDIDYGQKEGSNEFGVGTCKVKITNDDQLIGTTEETGDYSLDDIQKSSISIILGGTTLWHGTIRQAVLQQHINHTTMEIMAEDAMAELGSAFNIDLADQAVGQDIEGNIIYRPREQTGIRIHAILDMIGWGSTAAYRKVDPGTVYCEQLNSTNTTEENAEARGRRGNPLAMLRQAAATEWGRLTISHGRPVRDRNYNRGLLVFDSRIPPPTELIHIDQVSTTLATDSVRPSSDMKVVPDKRDLVNRVQLTDFYGLVYDRQDTESVQKYGTQALPQQPNLLSNGLATEGLGNWLLETYATPRLSIRQVKIAPYDYDEELALKCYRLSTDKVVRVSYINPASGVPTSTLHRIDRVKIKLRPGDLNLRDENGNFTGGAIADITLDLQIPQASAFWRYGVLGASEIGSTTIFSTPLPEEDALDASAVGEPFNWQEPFIISAVSWNTHMVNKLTSIYETEDERLLTPDRYRAQLRRDRPDITAFDLEREVSARVYRSRPRDVAGSGGFIEPQPADGVMSVAANRLSLYSFNEASGVDELVAHVEPLQAPGTFQWDGVGVEGRLDFGNNWGD